jgi:hypothetical protein
VIPVVKFFLPGRIGIELKYQARAFRIACLTVVHLGDGKAVRIVVGGNVTVALGQDTDVDVATLDIRETLVGGRSSKAA